MSNLSTNRREALQKEIARLREDYRSCQRGDYRDGSMGSNLSAALGRGLFRRIGQLVKQEKEEA